MKTMGQLADKHDRPPEARVWVDTATLADYCEQRAAHIRRTESETAEGRGAARALEEIAVWAREREG